MKTNNLASIQAQTLDLFAQHESNGKIIKAPAVALPTLRFDSTEQLSLALQNRDKAALEFLITDQMVSSVLKDKKAFIKNYLGYCKTLERKHGKVIVQILNGVCNGKMCSYGSKGITVSVNTQRNNKQVWKFNLIIEANSNGQLDLGQCINMKVRREDI